MTHLEIVKKLIGQIKPKGCSATDRERFENLLQMCELTNQLVAEIDEVAYLYKDSKEHSVKNASDYASEFLTKTLGIV